MDTTMDTMERTTRATREMAEAQRDSYEALAENLTEAQRRSVGLAKKGLEFFSLQEDNARAAQEWFANGAKLLQLQRRNAEFAQDWLSGGIEAFRDQTEHNLRTAEAFARSARSQQEGFRAFAEAWFGASEDFFSLFSPFASYAQQGLRTIQEATQQGLQATQQVAQQGLRVAEEGARQTEEVLRKTEEATREAELRSAVHRALKVEDYDQLSIVNISERLDGLSVDDLKKLREYEKQNRDRDTLVERIDRKIRVNS